MNIYKQIVISILVVIFFVGGAVALTKTFFNGGVSADTLRLDEQEATIRAINRATPGVVSISIFETTEKEKVKIGSGSGFLISADGLILTNKHVASAGAEGKSEYKITLYSGKQYYAQLIGKDPIDDLAVLKIFDKNLPYLELGDSNNLKVGTSVIAIGNALGRYANSATKGIISGLGRSLSASGNNGTTENLENVIQTDAQINVGNSGGPLINLEGKVIGINVAKDNGGESIGFAIPINKAKPVITSVKNTGRIIRSFLGVRYVTITPEIAEEEKLARSTGALIVVNDKGEAGILPDSPADKAGLLVGDIIFEVDGKKINEQLPLSAYVNQFAPGKKLGLKVQRGTTIFTKIVTLAEFK